MKAFKVSVYFNVTVNGVQCAMRVRFVSAAIIHPPAVDETVITETMNFWLCIDTNT